VKKNRVAAIAAAGAASLALSVLVPSMAHASSPETFAKLFCTTNPTLKNAGDWFSFNAWGNDYPGDMRIKIEFYRSSTSQGATTWDPTAETTTYSSGTWSSDTFYDGGQGSSGGDEEVRVQVVEESNDGYLGSSSLYSIPYNDCSPISYGPKA